MSHPRRVETNYVGSDFQQPAPQPWKCGQNLNYACTAVRDRCGLAADDVVDFVAPSQNAELCYLLQGYIPFNSRDHAAAFR
jgi:hypothetical protein